MSAPSKVACLGEITLDTIGSASTLSVDEIATYLTWCADTFGGRAANFLFAARRLGAAATLFGAVGGDFVATGYEERLVKESIDLRALFRVESARTPRVFLFSDSQSSRVYFSPGVVEEEQERFCEHLQVYLGAAAHRFDVACCTSWAARANEIFLSSVHARVKVYVPGHEVSLHSLESLRACVALADVVVLNRAEANVLEQRTGTMLGRVSGDKVVIVTRGSEGATVFQASGYSDIEAVKSANVVDATGAGDGFLAGVSIALGQGAPVVEACRYGAAVAALVVEQAGGQCEGLTIDSASHKYRAAYGRVPPWIEPE